jgi:hypothetical protein
MWKLDLKDKCVRKYIYDCFYIHTYTYRELGTENMIVIAGLGTTGRQERKGE